MGSALLTTDEAAKRLRLSVSSLGRWRVEGVGPAYIKRQGRVFYSPEALDDYLASTTRTKTRDEAPDAR